jgi:hypothetical protein
MLRRPLRTTVALAGLAALLLAGCGEDPTVEVEPTEEPEPTEDPAPDDDADDADDAGADDGAAATDDGTSADDDEDTPEPPTPDPALVDDPCGPDQERDDEAFITVVAPVADQHVSGDTVELVGCSNVFEANVQWSLYDGDGRELETGFTTAECGSGCVGAYRDEVSLEAFEGEPYAELHVYSEDAAGEQGRMFLVAVPLVLS